jgi:hypothetical protein
VLHQRYKDFYFLLIAQATWPNYWLKKLRHPGSRNGHRLDLHLGCGPKYLPGFVNIDANPMQKTDIWLDVRCGLPFASGSVDSIYSTHMIEHLCPDELERLLLECARVLKAGAGMRIIVTSLSNAILAGRTVTTGSTIIFPAISIPWEDVFLILCSAMDNTRPRLI